MKEEELFSFIDDLDLPAKKEALDAEVSPEILEIIEQTKNTVGRGAGLTKEEELYLLQLLEEREKREKTVGHLRWFKEEGDLSYDKYEKHMEFFKATADHQEVLFLAGNRVGKTIAGAYAVTCWATGIYPSWWEGRTFIGPTNGWVGGDTGQTVRDIAQKELLGEPGALGTGMLPEEAIVKVVPRPGIPNAVDHVLVEHAHGGTSYIGFKSYDQGRRSWQGTAKDYVWCVAENQWVTTKDGVKRIQNLKVGDTVISRDRTNLRQPLLEQKVKEVIYKGEKEVLAIHTKKRGIIRVTADHKVLVCGDRVAIPVWKKAGALKAGDRVIFHSSGWTGTKQAEQSIPELLGWFLGDGCWAEKQIKFTCGSRRIAKHVESLLPEDVYLRRKEFKCDHVDDYFLATTIYGKNRVRLLFESYGLEGKKAGTKFIPDEVFDWDVESVTKFLGMLYASDGWASGPMIGYCTISQQLVMDLSTILNRLGVAHSIVTREFKDKPWSKQYHLLICSSKGILDFSKLVRIVGKEEAQEKVVAEAKRRLNGEQRKDKRYTVISKIVKDGTSPVYDIVLDKKGDKDTSSFLLQGGLVVHNCDEEPALDVYSEALIRIMTTKGILISTLTPLKGLTPFIMAYLEQAGMSDVIQGLVAKK